ncbi:hypothetical protein Daura_14925 [Dactylosporangium aurantiacum]|uniref:Uncharacterized protein n=1 Tax=Dactylosporangium aurantiacum TaxID=35754 RepID=A0A9Q9MI02_9ACTN|nr:hypothetical protein [Dactylosporangium aurantiacum]MDG6108478.1 hypothetical protein [Dactylosporangium aurantiacum]UWZ57339.1 hypothetical protein Daura_14925 [Dactylosporangium aurantiacum]
MLTNLAHLDSLRVRITPPPQPGHTTYRLVEEPSVEVVWTYAERLPDGSYLPVGGGPVDPDTGHYTQGAFNADDIARAAVVYLRHWRATGADTSRAAARQLLRGLCYLQTVWGDTPDDDPADPSHGNVVLWQQPDGTLNRSGVPAETPDPSDSGESAWLARTVWALGEGYAAFSADPRGETDFPAFLRRRLRLAIAAIRRQVLPRYGQWRVVEESATPAWLIGDGADLTGEALLGLCAYTGCSGDDDARKLVEQLAEGVTAMRTGTPWTWPFGAVLPCALSRSAWHAWAGLAPAGLARVYEVAGDLAARDAALADAASFTPHLLVQGGPDNLRVAVPGAREALTLDGVQLSYGAQSRVESLLTTARVTGRPALSTLAGIAGSWFFGNNPAGMPMYDPATGRTYDGVDIPDTVPDAASQQPGRRGVVHRDAGAESTIHGLLAMLALDADPHAAAVARVAEADLDDGAGDCRQDSELHCLSLRDPRTGARVTLLRSVATSTRVCDVDLGGPTGTTEGTATVTVNDPAGEELEHYTSSAGRIRAIVPGGGFTIVTRMPDTG